LNKLHFSKNTVGKLYSITAGKLLKKKGKGTTDGGYFCSELVAEALKAFGVLSKQTSSAQYWPGRSSNVYH
jgi:hypothetical protein